jgi:hypothetical protein
MLGTAVSQIIVANTADAERIAIELVRNAIIAHPNANVATANIARWPLLRSFVLHQAPRFGATVDPAATHAAICVVGDGPEPVTAGTVDLAVALPGVRELPEASRRVVLAVGVPVGEVIVVPGTARTVNGTHTLTAESFGRLRRAADLASRRPVRVLVLSGWNGRSGVSEAAQLLAAWRGPRVPVILDEAARTTAENALWAGSFAAALGDVRRVRVVASWVAAPRLGLAMRAALRPTGARLRLSVVWGRTHAASWRPSIVGLVHLRRHLRAGRALLANGPADPGARL